MSIFDIAEISAWATYFAPKIDTIIHYINTTKKMLLVDYNIQN